MTETDFEQFVSLRTERMLRLAYLLSGVAHTAEDLVQEALLRCHRRWERVASVANPDAYLHRIIANQHLTWRRRRSSTALMVQPDHVPEEDAADSQDTLTVQDLLRGSLQQLPARQRTVLVLRYYEDLPDADVAALLGAHVGTVRSLATRAISRPRTHPELAGYALGWR